MFQPEGDQPMAENVKSQMSHKNMVNPQRNTEAAHKKPTVKDSVESLIERKKSEREAKVAESVSEKMAGTKEGVAEVMAGMEKPKEKVSEREGETGEMGDLKGGAGAITDEAIAMAAAMKDYIFPSEIVMIKKIRTAIKAQIKIEMKKARKFQSSLNAGEAASYNKAISRIRHLKEILASLFTATFGFLKNMYVKYFTPEGHRKDLEEIQ